MQITEQQKTELIAYLIDHGFHESKINGQSHGYVNKEAKQGIEFGKGSVEAFRMVDLERNIDEGLMINLMGEFQNYINSVKEAGFQNSIKNVGPAENNTQIALMPENITKELMEKYSKIGLFEKLSLFRNTDKRFVKTKKGAGNQVFQYVDGHYMTDVLNLITGYAWDCQIEKIIETDKEVICIGSITLNLGDEYDFRITKSAVGQADKKFSKESKELIMIGDTYKAAQTDMIKKAASYLGIAADVYRGEA